MLKSRFVTPAAAKRGNDFPVRALPVRAARLAFAAFAVLLGGGSVFADSIPVTSGVFSQIVEDGETGFTFRGPGIFFDGFASIFPTATCAPCIPGSSFNLSATATPSDLQGGTWTFDGQTHDSVYYGGTFTFSAGSVIVPDVSPGGEPARPTTSFRFEGTLLGFADPSRTGTPLFSTELIGGGTASVVFLNFANAPGLHPDGYNYVFSDVSATPEPASLLLFGSGMAWLAVRRRGARRLGDS
jgi:hypothetical protein